VQDALTVIMFDPLLPSGVSTDLPCSFESCPMTSKDRSGGHLPTRVARLFLVHCPLCFIGQVVQTLWLI
jgi:hypothetical protein